MVARFFFELVPYHHVLYPDVMMFDTCTWEVSTFRLGKLASGSSGGADLSRLVYGIHKMH